MQLWSRYWIHNPFFLHYPLFTNERYTLLNTLSSIDFNLLNNIDFVLTKNLFFGNLSFNSNKKSYVFNNRNDLLHLSLTLKIAEVSEAYI